jgi:hypothetical protein
MTIHRGDAVDKVTLTASGEVTVAAQGETVLSSKP